MRRKVQRPLTAEVSLNFINNPQRGTGNRFGIYHVMMFRYEVPAFHNVLGAGEDGVFPEVAAKCMLLRELSNYSLLTLLRL